MISECLRRVAAVALATNIALVMPGSLLAGDGRKGGGFVDSAAAIQTTTPIKHVIVIFQENVSFDHYFATYPHATNPEAEPQFHARPDTPRVNNLLAGGLLDENPNSTQPFRMDTGLMSVTCDQNHSYTPEQAALDHGLMDKFPESTGSGNSAAFPCNDYGKGNGVVMGYFDGNTVTALWNYAQHFAMSDNSYGTMFGPSAVGALNLIAGTTATATLFPTKPNGATASPSGNIANGSLGVTVGPVIGDPRPAGDECVLTNPQLADHHHGLDRGKERGRPAQREGPHVGLVPGGLWPTAYNAKGQAVCGANHTGLAGNDDVETSRATTFRTTNLSSTSKARRICTMPGRAILR